MAKPVKKPEPVKKTNERNNQKAYKKTPKVFDPVKRRLVNAVR